MTDDEQEGFAAEFPELHTKIQAGEMTLAEAFVEAGIGDASWACPVRLESAAAEIARRYADRIAVLLDAIAQADAGNRGPR